MKYLQFLVGGLMTEKTTTANEIANNNQAPKIDYTDSLNFMLKVANRRLKANLEEIEVIKLMQCKVASSKNSSN